MADIQDTLDNISLNLSYAPYLSPKPSGNLATGKKYLTPTGVGKSLELKDFQNPSNTIKCGANSDWADYTDINDALEAAFTMAQDTVIPTERGFVKGTVYIELDYGVFTINRNINLTNSGNGVFIVLIGKIPNNQLTGDTTNTYGTFVNVDTTLTGNVISLSYITLEFREISIEIKGAPTPILGQLNIFKASGGTNINFIKCYVRGLDFNSSDPDHRLRLAYSEGGGTIVRFEKCSISLTPIYSADSTAGDAFFIDLRGTHNDLIMIDTHLYCSAFTLNQTNFDVGFCNLQNLNNDDIPFFFVWNNYVEIFLPNFSTNFFFLKTNVNKDQLNRKSILKNTFTLVPRSGATTLTGTVYILYADSQNNDLVVVSSSNKYARYPNNLSNYLSTKVFYLSTGDSIISDYDTFTNIDSSDYFDGTGSFYRNLDIQESPITVSDLSDWSEDPVTIKNAINYLAAIPTYYQISSGSFTNDTGVWQSIGSVELSSISGTTNFEMILSTSDGVSTAYGRLYDVTNTVQLGSTLSTTSNDPVLLSNLVTLSYSSAIYEAQIMISPSGTGEFVTSGMSRIKRI